MEGQEEEDADSGRSSHDHHKEDAKGGGSAGESEDEDDEGSVKVDDVEVGMENKKSEQEMKPLTPQELLKEKGWEKLITDRMKSLIDE